MFVFTMSTVVLEALRFILLFNSLHLISFFLYSHSRTGGVHLGSEHETLKVHSSTSRHLQDEYRISRRNAKTGRGTSSEGSATFKETVEAGVNNNLK
jgi:hypothetical protein